MSSSPFVRPQIELDWRLTARCSASCPVCPLIDPQSRDPEIRGELSLQEACRVIDLFHQLVRDWEIQSTLRLWGGELARRPDLLNLLEYAGSQGPAPRNGSPPHKVEGAPFRGGSPPSAPAPGGPGVPFRTEWVGCARNLEGMEERLKRAGVSRISFPLFGLGETHDRFHSPGDFSATLRTHRTLQELGMETAFLFLWSRELQRELREILRLIERERVSSFSFLRHPFLCRDHPSTFGFSAGEFFSMMFELFEGWMTLPRSSPIAPPSFLEREPLWSLFYQTWGMTYEKPEERGILEGGCRAGCSTLGVRADGVVYPCLFLPRKIGEVPAQSLREIFIESRVLNELREVAHFVKCRGCNLAQVCRGCPAMGAIPASGSPLNGDPHCWKEISEGAADG